MILVAIEAGQIGSIDEMSTEPLEPDHCTCRDRTRTELCATCANELRAGLARAIELLKKGRDPGCRCGFCLLELEEIQRLLSEQRLLTTDERDPDMTPTRIGQAMGRYDAEWSDHYLTIPPYEAYKIAHELLGGSMTESQSKRFTAHWKEAYRVFASARGIMP